MTFYISCQIYKFLITIIILMKDLTKEFKLRKIDKSQEVYYSQALMLGKGAFAGVYLGFDETAHRPFACKKIELEKLSHHSNNEQIIKKIKDEIYNMSMIQNEHIVEFYQAKTSERNIYISCEYCNGDNLEKYLRNRGYLTEVQALTFFKEILKGFKSLSEKKIVHRDIKPANLLMHNCSIKIADLGFSKSIDSHEQLLESAVGSPLYMSPQIFERQKYTEKTDIWSLGVIFYEILYGKNPFAGCGNIMELKERVKKDIHFPAYPYVSNDTKRMIKRIMVVEEKDRIDWEYLFNKYLTEPSVNHFQEANRNYYTLNTHFSSYFRDSYFIQSPQHLHKVLKTVKLCTQEYLSQQYPFYETTERFFSEIAFWNAKKAFIEEYFACFLEKRNKISYLIVLCEKISKMVASNNNEQFSILAYCIYLLAYKFSLTLIQEMISSTEQIILFDQKYESLYNKYCYQRFLCILLQKDRELLTSQLNTFTSYFRAMMSSLAQNSSPILNTIQRDLSGIYSSQSGDKRVISFYLNNYLKKVHLVLKNIILAQSNKKSTQMVNEQEQINQTQANLPSLSITTCKLIQEYLRNPDLFNIKIQSSNQNLQNFNNAVFRKNLNQILYDFETTIEQNFFQQLSQSKPFEEQSIVSFMSKEIRWNSIFVPRLI